MGLVSISRAGFHVPESLWNLRPVTLILTIHPSLAQLLIWDLRQGSGGSSAKLLGGGGLFQHALLRSIDLVTPLVAAQQRLLEDTGGVAGGVLQRPSYVHRVSSHPEDTSILALVMQVGRA